MIYVWLEGHDFRYETEDIIKLFFEDDEMLYTNTEPPEDYRGIFIWSILSEKADGVTIRTTVNMYGKDIIQKEAELYLHDDKDNTALKDRLKRLKKGVKHQLYITLSQATGRKMPWGTLTGIRPAKIVHELLNSGEKEEAVFQKLVGHYMVSGEKAQLLIDVANAEKKILKRTKGNSISLYIGIPFCTTRCLYCSFTSNSIGKNYSIVENYFKSLETEIINTGKLIKDCGLSIQSIYIGGGTPTSIKAETLDTLLEMVEKHFDLSRLEEYTLEAGRPDTITESKLRSIKCSRVDRISINPQTMNDETLRLIGRDHSAEDIVNTFKMARDLEFDNINMDVIAGLPGEGLEMFEHTLQEIGKLGPDSLTVHTLAVKRASKLREEKSMYTPVASQKVGEMLDTAHRFAGSIGLKPYYLYRQKNMVGNLENIGYSRAGAESIYNIQIMEEKQSIIALGAGAVTKVVYPFENRIERAFNVKNVDEYIRRVDEMVERKKALLM